MAHTFLNVYGVIRKPLGFINLFGFMGCMLALGVALINVDSSRDSGGERITLVETVGLLFFLAWFTASLYVKWKMFFSSRYSISSGLVAMAALVFYIMYAFLTAAYLFPRGDDVFTNIFRLLLLTDLFEVIYLFTRYQFYIY